MNQYALVALAVLVVGAGLVGIGALCFCLMRLSDAVEVGVGAGQEQEFKRALKAIDGRVEDAVNQFERRFNRDQMRTTREKPAPNGAAQPDQLTLLRERIRGGGRG